MPSTLVLQSHKSPLPFAWLAKCLDSVRHWAQKNQFDYRFIGDELFDLIDVDLVEKTSHQKVIATDIARLYAIQRALSEYERVIWLDADFLIFAPRFFKLPESEELPEGYMLGREVWVQEDVSRLTSAESYIKKTRIKLKAKVKVHNAFLLFDRDNSFLDFYLVHAERLLRHCFVHQHYESNPSNQSNALTIPPQFAGPKLLTALHNIVQCPVMELAGMLSPLVVKDLVSNGQSSCALKLFKKRSPQPVSAANLCSSLQAGNDQTMTILIDGLLSDSVPI